MEYEVGGGGKDFLGAGLLGGRLRAKGYRRSPSSEAESLRTQVGVLALDCGGSEFENELADSELRGNVMAEVGVGVRDPLEDVSSDTRHGEKGDLAIVSRRGCALVVGRGKVGEG